MTVAIEAILSAPDEQASSQANSFVALSTPKVDAQVHMAATTVGPILDENDTQLQRSLKSLVFFLKDRDYTLYVMSFAFVLLFFAYPIQGVQTIRYPSTGSYILLILYAFYGLTALFASPLVDLAGPEFLMPFGALSYGFWIATEFSGSNALVLVGAAAFGIGAGVMWVSAGNILATISQPHNRGSNNGIFVMAFHLGVFSGGLTLGGVTSAFSNYDDQYSVFLGLCGASFVTFLIFIPLFRARYRVKKVAAAASAVANASSFRVVHDDGRVEYRAVVEIDTVKSADIVVANLALNGGRSSDAAKLSFSNLPRRMYQSIEFFWNPLFAPVAPVIIVIGGVCQGWFNASFNKVANYAGGSWVGWVYAISESFGIIGAIAFGLVFDRLRRTYDPRKYRWIIYYSLFGTYAMCGCAIGATYLMEQTLGTGPGELAPAKYYLMLIATCFFYNTSWVSMELSVYTYLTTFITYNSDIAFSTKICCEAIGYLISYGLSDVLSPRDLTIVIIGLHTPAALSYILFFKAPATPSPILVNVELGDNLVKPTELSRIQESGLHHTSSALTLPDTTENTTDLSMKADEEV